MAAEKKLDCVILGLLSHEDLTGYEIKKRIDEALRFFWGASYGSIYPTLNELVVRGLATKRQDDTSRRSKLIYTITDEGHHYLQNWLKQPVEKDELRYETLLKLFFGNEQTPQQVVGHIKAFELKTKKNLQQLLGFEQVLKNCADEDPTHQYYLLTVQFGIHSYQAYLNWCGMAIDTLERKS